MNPEDLIISMKECAQIMEKTSLEMMFFADINEAFEQNAAIVYHLSQALERFAESCSMSLEANANGTMTVH